MSDNHKAIVCPLKNIHKHPNADRLNIATASGYNIITGLENYEGQLGLYFSCDLQLSAEFAEKNDLIRRKDENGVQCGGMFEENRRVRAQKLRGAISDGFWIPMDSLDFTDADYSVLQEGQLIDSFNGIPLCNKYVTPSTQKSSKGSSNQKPSRDKIITKMFKEHLDTSHWVRCDHTVDDDTPLIVSLKTHGCVDGNTLIETLAHGDLKIRDIVNNRLKTKVKALDTIRNEIIYVDIDDYYFYPDDSGWYQIELDDGRILEITGNNPVWIPDLKAYRRVDELVGTEMLLVD